MPRRHALLRSGLSGVSIRTRLFLLVAVVAVPLLALTGAGVWYAYATVRSEQAHMLVSRAGSIAALADLYLPQDELADSLRHLDLPPHWVAGITDRSGRLAARTPPEPDRVGKPVTPDFLAALHRAPSGVLANGHHAPDGTGTVLGFATSPLGYHAFVAMPAALFAAPQRAAVVRTGILAFLISALGVFAAWRVGSGMANPLRRLAAAPFDAAASGVPEIDTLAWILAEARRHQIEDERSLRESDARLRLALSAGRMAVWEYDMATQNVVGSPALYRVLGFPEGATPSIEDIRAHYRPEDRERVEQVGKTAHDRGERFFETEFGYLPPGGAERWLLMRAEIVCRDGIATGVVGVVLDMTAERQIARALRDDEERLRELVATLDLAAVFMRGIDGIIRFWSKGCERLYGWPASVAVGAHAHELLKTEFPVSLAATERELARTGEWTGDLIQSRRDGARVAVAVRKMLRRDAEGLPLAVLESVADVTALRQATVELERLNEELEQRVRAEVSAREAAQVRAAHAERMQALGQLAGGIAHDFNNVLQAVTGAAALVERRPDRTEQVSRFARLILDASARGSAITGRLLAFARRGDLRAEPVAAADMLEGLAEILGHTLGSTIAIEIRVEPGLPPMMVDRGQLETVLVNLATNARDAMPGGGRLSLAAERRRGDTQGDFVALSVPGDYVAISVTDTGSGMDEATLARATEPFFTTKQRGEGTGLGLAMAKGFAEQSGGALALRSAAGRGTTVTLFLPAAEAGAALPIPTESAPMPSEAARARVLLSDDDPLVRDSLAAQLEAAGFAVLAVPGGAAALERLRAGEAVDVLVTDLSMPDMDGLALIRAAHAERPRLPAVLLTGYAGDSAAPAVGGAVSGPFSLLRKPVSGTQLADRILTLLEAARAAA